MDDAGGLRRLCALCEGPCPHLVGAGSEVGAQVEQCVCGTDQTVHATLLEPEVVEKLATLFISLQLGDLTLRLGCHHHHVGILPGKCCLHLFDIMITRNGTPLIHIAEIEHRLIGQQEQFASKFLLLLTLDGDATRRAPLLQRLFICLKHTELHLRSLISAGLGSLLRLRQSTLHSLQILDLQLIIDHLHIAHRVHSRVDMSDIIIIETAEHMDDGIRLADISQELIAEALTLRGPLHEPGDVDDLHRSRDHRPGVAELHEASQTIIGHRDHTHIRFNSTEREISRLCLRIAKTVKESGLADIGQPHDTALQGHNTRYILSRPYRQKKERNCRQSRRFQ